MRGKSYIFLVFTALIVILSAGLPNVYATNRYVATNPAACGGLTPVYPDVSTAISFANPGDTIVLCENITENIDVLNINKPLIIYGGLGGNLFTWALRDTNNSTPTLVISDDVQFIDIVLDVAMSVGLGPDNFIEINSANVSFTRSFINGSLNVPQDNVLINVTPNSNLILRHSNVTLFSPDPNVYTTLVYAENANITINPSIIIHRTNGTAMNLIFNTPQFFSLDIEANLIISRNGIAVNITVSNNAYLKSSLRYTTINGSIGGLEVYSLGAMVDLSISDSHLFSWKKQALWLYLDTVGYMNVYIDSTILEIQSYWSVFLPYRDNSLQAILYGMSTLDLFITNSLFIANYSEPYVDNNIDIDISGGSYATVTVLNTILIAEDLGIDIRAYDGSADLYVNGVVMNSSDYLHMFLLANPGSLITGRVENSIFPRIWLRGDGTISLDLIETVIDEVGSESGTHRMYIEWTLYVYVLTNPFSTPVPGADVYVYEGSNLIAYGKTDVNGRAVFKFSYLHRDGEYFGANLTIRAYYDGILNSTNGSVFINAYPIPYWYPIFYPWLDPIASFTLPYWYGNVTIYLDIFAITANLVGDLGYGVLTLNNFEGRLVAGAFNPTGWKTVYMVKVYGKTVSGKYMILYISVLYKGNWVDGYIFAHLEDKWLYMNFGGVEMYGSFRTL